MNPKIIADNTLKNNTEGKLVFVNPDADGVGNGETIS